ncbi:malectin domain-containing carbohydrate-binding protein [Mobilicoccus pelagius]|uniref:GH16 domain-containing protein n=1 Tax=Mobilicoccus pelagius NBRC 104925 TaxID=1089455 RepID=H5UQU7_9MICO|nr:malectin domain-containing carbohydrate-binding protein [Mobilicoccus pelagius]GAB48105.1 hypothetical protein MOPEL_060_00210 [Mobilicoccus pelagius NBRC 104925]
MRLLSTPAMCAALALAATSLPAVAAAVGDTPATVTTGSAATTGSTATTGSGAVYRMTVGPAATTTANGTVYSARAGFVGGRYNGSLYRSGADVRGTTDDALYYPEWCVPAGWQKPVTNGTYDVTLKMREAYFSYPGQRVFSVDAEGRRVATDIDILKAVGKNAAYDRTFRVAVSDGRLDLRFPATRDGASISAIVVAPVATSTPAPAPPAKPMPSPSPTVAPAPLGVPGTWRVDMRDEFDGSALDTSVWTPHRGLAPYTYGHPYNASLDAYSFAPSRVSVRGGALRLAWDPTRSTVRNGDGSTTTYPYTAGVAHSGRGFTMTSGYVEARIKVPRQSGLWPAFWMLPTPVDSTWPPEIDIAEIIPDDTPDGLEKPHFNYHWKAAGGGHRQMGWRWFGDAGRSYTGEWHTYGLLREPGRLQVFVDGRPGPSFTDPAVTTDPMYVVLSSGVRKGHTPPAGEMLVDYVRAWKKG